MRILHTADWHMNNRLGRVDIAPHIVDALEQIAVILETEAVDVMVVAGDLFSERSSREGLRTAIGEIRRIFGPFMARGGHIVAIAGNHDSELFFETLRDALELAAPVGGTSRLHLTASPQLLTLIDPVGTRVQFVLLPYPTARWYLRGAGGREGVSEESPTAGVDSDSSQSTPEYTTLEEKNRLIQTNFARALADLQAQLDPVLPAVLVSHVHVRGAVGHTLYKISETDDILFDPQTLGETWDYVAYGHIHKPGSAFSGRAHIRYSGSIARLDAAERDDEKQVVLVDIGPEGRRGEPRVQELRARTLHQITINGQEELSALEATWENLYPDAREALVHLTIGHQPGTDNLPAMLRATEKLFPLWYDRKIERLALLNTVGSAIIASLAQAGDVRKTVRDYLQERFADHAERETLLARAEELLAQS